MGSRDAAVCYDSGSDSICPSPSTNLRLYSWRKPPPHTHTITERPLSFTVGMILVVAALSHRPTYLNKWFWTLIRRSKGLYSTVLLSSLFAPWSTGAFWYCFASSAMVSWPQFCHLGRLHGVVFSQSMLTQFSRYLLSRAVMSRAASLLSRKMDDFNEIVLYSCWSFWSTSPTFSLVLSYFLISPNIIIHNSSCSVLRKENAFKSIFQKISGYTKFKVDVEMCSFYKKKPLWFLTSFIKKNEIFFGGPNTSDW